MKKSLLTLLIGFTTVFAPAQVDTLTYEQCVQAALEKNYGILIALDEQEILDQKATKGNADFLPTISIGGGVEGGISNVTQTIIGQPERKIDGARSTSENLNVKANYTVFNGNTRLYTYKKLLVQSEIGELETKQKVEQVMVEIASYYYQVAGLQASLGVVTDVLGVSANRYKRAEYKYEYGDALKIDVLNAEVDLNQDSLNYLTVRRDLEKAKQNLKILLGEEPTTNFNVSTKVEFLDGLLKESLLDEMSNSNTSLLIAEKRIQQYEFDLGIAKGSKYPKLDAGVAYNFGASQSESGIVSQSISQGPTANVTLAFDLFTGGKRNINIQTSKITVDRSQKNKENHSLTLKKDIENEWSEYEYQLDVIRLQQRNINTTKLNFERSEELYNFGQLTSTQYREAQVNSLRAQYEFIKSTASLKVAEIKLLQLSGRLVE